MDIKVNELVERFKDILPEKYNDISIEKLKEITKTPFQYIGKEMDCGNFNEVRLIHFGVFRPIKSKIRTDESKDNTK